MSIEAIREALTLGELIGMRMPRDADDCRLTIRVENPGGLTAHQTVNVVSAQFGFDWEARQLVLIPSCPVSAMSTQDVEDLRKSARAGQSWHAYQAHKQHSDEKDALRAKLASVEAERDDLLQRLDEAEKALQWRPIETAPKDGPILVWGPWLKHPFLVDKRNGTWVTPGKVVVRFGEEATHWLPLPPAPKG